MRLCAVAAPLTLVGAATGCGGDDGSSASVADASYDLQIGHIAPLTGSFSVVGPPTRKAVELAVEQANEASEAAELDVTVSSTTADTQTDPQAAVQAGRKVVVDGATCIVGPFTTAGAIPVGESVATVEEVPIIAPSASAAELADLDDTGFVNRTIPADPLEASALAEVVKKNLGGAEGKTVNVAGRNDSYGEGYVQAFSDAWEALGGTVGTNVLYDPMQATLDGEAQEIVSGDPDAYVIADFGDTYGKVGAALLRTGDFSDRKSVV